MTSVTVWRREIKRGQIPIIKPRRRRVPLGPKRETEKKVYSTDV